MENTIKKKKDKKILNNYSLKFKKESERNRNIIKNEINMFIIC